MAGSIAQELFAAIRLRDYCVYINKLNTSDAITVADYHKSDLVNQYVLDTRVCFSGKRVKVNHLYEIFGDFSSTEGELVKCDMLKEITDHFDWYQDRAKIILLMQGYTLSDWLQQHLKKVRPDEIALYALSHLYNRHTVVFGNGRPWCTIRPTGDPKEADFATSCHVHLLYLGENVFAPLTPRKRPATLEFPLFVQLSTSQALPQPAADETDEDDNFLEATSALPAALPAGQSNVQDTHRRKTVASALEAFEQKAANTATCTAADMKSINQAEDHCATTSGNNDDVITKKRECFVSLQRLSDEDIDKYISKLGDTDMTLSARKPKHQTRHPHKASSAATYTGMDNTYDEYEPDSKKRKTSCAPGYGPSSARLRAQQLISKQRILLETEDDMTSSNDDDDTSPGISAPVEPVQETKEKTVEKDKIDNSAPVPGTSKSGKVGQLVVQEHKLVKPKRQRSFTCITCKVVTHSTMAYNRHYSANHPPLKCQDCHRMFTNPTSLQRHRYNHTKKDGVYPCNRCKKVFPFWSQLQSHKFIHRRIAHFPCSGDGCKKIFMRKADLTSHALIHKKVSHNCDQCTYTTYDKRYLKQHSRVHSNINKYHCEMCGKGFRFYQQYK